MMLVGCKRLTSTLLRNAIKGHETKPMAVDLQASKPCHPPIWNHSLSATRLGYMGPNQS